MFNIAEVKPTKPPTYRVKYITGELLDGSFYEPELQKSNQQVYVIDKVVRTRIRNGRKEDLIKWRGYSSKFNSWEPASKVGKYMNMI